MQTQTETNQKRALFTESYPILNVNNVAASIAYYCDTLGFEKGFTWPPECNLPGAEQIVPTFAQVGRGQFFLMLAQQEQGGQGMWIYLDLASVEDMAALYQEYLASGAKIVEPPTDKPWNMREMFVHDLDGHTLRIGAIIPE